MSQVITSWQFWSRNSNISPYHRLGWNKVLCIWLPSLTRLRGGAACVLEMSSCCHGELSKKTRCQVWCISDDLVPYLIAKPLDQWHNLHIIFRMCHMEDEHKVNSRTKRGCLFPGWSVPRCPILCWSSRRTANGPFSVCTLWSQGDEYKLLNGACNNSRRGSRSYRFFLHTI